MYKAETNIFCKIVLVNISVRLADLHKNRNRNDFLTLKKSMKFDFLNEQKTMPNFAMPVKHCI